MCHQIAPAPRLRPLARPMRLALQGLLLALLLAGCAAQPCAPEQAASPQDPEALHAAWVHAMLDGDRDAALALYDPQASFRADEVETWMKYVQNYVQVVEARPDSTFTPFLRVETRPVEARGARFQALSVWISEAPRHRPAELNLSCYRTTLGKVDGALQVIDWESLECPDTIQIEP